MSFGIEQLELSLYLSEKNILPESARKELYKWCGSGVMLNLKYTKAGLPVTRHFEEAIDFVKKSATMDEAMGFLASINKEYRSFVQAVRNESQVSLGCLDAQEDLDMNICEICFEREMEVALACGHTFCDRCISDWVLKQTNCPMCRQDVKASGFFLVGNSKQEVLKMRSEVLVRLRNLIGQILDEEPLVADLKRMSSKLFL